MIPVNARPKIPMSLSSLSLTSFGMKPSTRGSSFTVNWTLLWALVPETLVTRTL